MIRSKYDKILIHCKQCKLLKNKIQSGKRPSGNAYYYKDERGFFWDGRTCPDCRKIKNTQSDRAQGRHKSIDDVKEYRIMAARNSEHIARKYFERLGFEVEMTKIRGPDLICKKGNAVLNVEVKRMIDDGRIKRKTYRITPVKRNRIKDDYVAIIFGENVHLVQPMKDHLAACSPSGCRRISL